MLATAISSFSYGVYNPFKDKSLVLSVEEIL